MFSEIKIIRLSLNPLSGTTAEHADLYFNASSVSYSNYTDDTNTLLNPSDTYSEISVEFIWQ